MPICAVALYFAVGDPDYLDQPYKDVNNRKEALMKKSSSDLIADFRAKLKENDSAKARHFLGETLARMGRFGEATEEFKKAYELSKGADTNIAVSYGEILVAMNNRTVSDEALAVFKEVLEKEDNNPPSLFYAGLYYFQNDQTLEGTKFWNNLIDASEGKPWQARMVANIQKSAEINKIDLAGNNIILPEVKEGFTPDQIDMIEGMVESLRQKVKDNPDDEALKTRLADVEKKFEAIQKGRAQ